MVESRRKKVEFFAPPSTLTFSRLDNLLAGGEGQGARREIVVEVAYQDPRASVPHTSPKIGVIGKNIPRGGASFPRLIGGLSML